MSTLVAYAKAMIDANFAVVVVFSLLGLLLSLALLTADANGFAALGTYFTD
jgi:hypothetical protein